MSYERLRKKMPLHRFLYKITISTHPSAQLCPLDQFDIQFICQLTSDYVCWGWLSDPWSVVVIFKFLFPHSTIFIRHSDAFYILTGWRHLTVPYYVSHYSSIPALRKNIFKMSSCVWCGVWESLYI